MPHKEVDIETIHAMSANAVVYYCGYDKQIPEGMPVELRTKAQKCAEAILEGKCTMWQPSKNKKDGFEPKFPGGQ